MKKIIYTITILLLLFCSCKKTTTDIQPIDPSKFQDARDLEIYQTVKIGNQVWMAENLRYLPTVMSYSTNSGTTPCYYLDGYNGTVVADAKTNSNYRNYGVIYNWPAAMVAAPTGWHLPSEAEWQQLINYCGGDSVAGGKLKETGTTYWNTPNSFATNDYGFNARGTGILYSYQYIYEKNKVTFWWSSTTNNVQTYTAEVKGTGNTYKAALRRNEDKNAGLPVRCIKD